MTVDGVVRAVVVGLLVVGRDVGKLGSVGDSGLVTGVPWVPDWHPATSAPAASTHARTSRLFIRRKATQPQVQGPEGTRRERPGTNRLAPVDHSTS